MGKTLRSTRITSLIVAGNTATIRGEGRVNGGPVVAFRVDVTDGNPDTFRITFPGYSAAGSVRGGGISIGDGDDDGGDDD